MVNKRKEPCTSVCQVFWTIASERWHFNTGARSLCWHWQLFMWIGTPKSVSPVFCGLKLILAKPEVQAKETGHLPLRFHEDYFSYLFSSKLWIEQLGCFISRCLSLLLCFVLIARDKLGHFENSSVKLHLHRFLSTFFQVFIKIMHSLDPVPFAQLSDITAQYLLRRYLLQPGLELLHSWHTALLLNFNTPSVNCLFSIFVLFLDSQVWLNYVLRDVLWQTESPGEVHLNIRGRKLPCEQHWSGSFFSPLQPLSPPSVDTLRKRTNLRDRGETVDPESVWFFLLSWE